MDAQFLNQYENELAYLRQTGSEFASRFPTLAGKLGLDEFHCSDPFVERLLEGFAFLTARVHRRLDAEFPRFTTSLIDSVFPLATRPVPAAGIFRIDPVLDAGSLLAGYTVPRGTRLFSAPAAQSQTGCRFDLTDDVHLWPLEIVEAHFLSRDHSSPQTLPACFHDPHIRSVLLITLATTVAAPIAALPLDKLRLHLRGGEVAHLLTEYLLAHASLLALQTADSHGPTHWTVLDQDSICPVGFAADQSLFPADHRVFSGHRLLHEYFLLPEKFLFVDLMRLQPAVAQAQSNRIQIAIGFNQSTPRLVGRVAAEHLDLFCAPAINLFQRRTDRVWLDHAQHEQLLIADRSRVNDYEIWSVEEMALHSPASAREVPCRPLYASTPGNDRSTSASVAYGLERRTRVGGEFHQDARAAYSGTDCYVTLSEAADAPSLNEFQQLSATTYCTNRALPLLVPANGWRTAFQAEAAGPIHRVICVTGPTAPRAALTAEQGDVAWRFVNQLTPSYDSLIDDGPEGCKLLRELLRLFCPPGNPAALRQVDGLKRIQHKPLVKRLLANGPITYARGVEIELTCDEQSLEGGVAFILGCVLEQYFARYVALNSFTELHLVSTQRGSIHRWPVRCGAGPLI